MTAGYVFVSVEGLTALAVIDRIAAQPHILIGLVAGAVFLSGAAALAALHMLLLPQSVDGPDRAT